jgi:hypothetical protein
VVKLVNTRDLKSLGFGLAGSSPAARTTRMDRQGFVYAPRVRLGWLPTAAANTMDTKKARAEWKFGTRAYQAGDLVFQEGDMGAEAYIVQSGEVDILKSTAPGLLCTGFQGLGQIHPACVRHS